MKLFYSCIGRLRSYPHHLWLIVKDKSNKIFWPAVRGHRLLVSGRLFFMFLCFMLFSIGIVRSQSPSGETADNSNITPLNIGDPIPEELWNLPLQVVNHPNGKETVTLSEYKDKLIILDFWATWCVPCIRNFPKLHALQEEFGDQIKVLAVTQEDSEKIRTFFTSGVGKEHTYVNSVVNDKVLSAYFPHKTVPHIAWIKPHGEFLNTTQAEVITKENIQQILQGQAPNLIGKVDIDQDRPLFLSEHFGENMELRSYSIFAKGYYPGLPSGNKIRQTKDGKIYARRMTNATMMDIYRPMLSSLFEESGEVFNSKRMVIDVGDPSLLNSIEKTEGGYENNNKYNYELVVPEDKADSLFFFMLEDLNRYSDFKGSIETRIVNCLVLVRTSSKDKIKSKGQKRKISYPSTSGISFINCRVDHVLNILNEDAPINLPIIDETKYLGNVDLEISDFKDLASMKEELNGYDLDLVLAKRNLNMFVLKDK